MKKIVSFALAAVMVCAMSISVCAAPMAPGRLLPGEYTNNAVLSGLWLETNDFVPVSSGVGDCTIEGQEKSGMTADLFHVFPNYTGTAQSVAAAHGSTIVCAFGVKLPPLLSGGRVVLHVKDGFDMPSDIVAVSMHGEKFNTIAVEKVNDRQIALNLKASDNQIYIFQGGNLAAGTEETYKDCLGWK
ncbi:MULTISPECIES: hypothetical protein [unclassified Butyrivibrio]|uniref:hypothetical protein n=1 Tax=unclassified Butyrivibrio TaxID=2639466 RepID=UPI0003B7A776|nr:MULTISPECIES: hypothetical protein [unclassified Butyrivibrio]SDB20210.1 hypothetical protein SAMN02910263_00988 [Butyrivibrio sp. INlla16]SEL58964.1 hypothetical protein SAMN04487770_11318 [Butyrivibrio sp. ob235]